MAKPGKQQPRYKQTTKPKPAAAPVRPAAERPKRDWLSRPSFDLSNDSLLRKVFWGVAALSLAVLIALSFGSGINGDEKFQADYSKKLVSYYSTWGKDTSALNVPDGYMHLYGGFFEVVTGFANKALGLEEGNLGYHHIRHVSCAVLGWVALLCTALLARLIAGWQAGVFTMIILLLSPRFVGESIMNPKDIPFAAGYMMALYNMAAVLNRMPKPSRWNLLGLVGGLAIALAMRAGGLLVFVYLGMFAGLHFLLKNGGFAALSNLKLISRYALITLGAAAAGYVLAILFWPYALQSPLKNPLEALTKFTDYAVRIRVLYEGKNVLSDQEPWHYPVKWIVYTIPMASIAGLAGYVALLYRFLKKYNPLWVFMVLFACIFPVWYVIYKQSPLYDGWRHLTFVYLPLALAAALFWNELVSLVSSRKYLKYTVLAVFAALLIHGGVYMASNSKFPYTYFNPAIGGIKGAYGKFETDYWGLSVRQGIEWMEQQGILRPDMPEQVVIATNTFYAVRQLTAKYGDKVKVAYLKWERRCDAPWDYALYPTRFIDGSTLRQGKWPPDNAVHTIDADGVPLLAILKDGNKCAAGRKALKEREWPSAINFLREEVENVPDNDLAWSLLAEACLNAGFLEEAKGAADKSLKINPDDMQTNNLLGNYWLQKGDKARAQAQFLEAIRREPTNAAAYYYLALIAIEREDNRGALNHLRKAIEVAPNFKAAYELSAQIYEATGNTSAAQQFREALKQL